MTYDSLLDGLYRISFKEPDYDSCLRIPARAGCSEVDMFMVPVEPDYDMEYDMEYDAQDLAELLDELLAYAKANSEYLVEKWDLQRRTEAWVAALGIGETPNKDVTGYTYKITGEERT